MKLIYVLLAVSLLLPFNNWAQEEVEKIDPSFSLLYQKNADGTKVISGTAKYRKDRKWTRISDLTVNFFSITEDGEEVFLAKTKTNKDGIASLSIHPDFGLQLNAEGYYIFIGRSESNDLFEETEEELEIRELILELSINEEDGDRTVTVNAHVYGEENQLVPLSDEDIYFFVPRMFSDMPIGDCYLEEGTGTLEFPGNLIGDTEGNLPIIAKVLEHDDFGNVITSIDSKWGIPKKDHLAEHPSRELWTPIAPMWMIITLIVLLAGVWGHYVYTVVQLFQIKKLGKEYEDRLEN